METNHTCRLIGSVAASGDLICLYSEITSFGMSELFVSVTFTKSLKDFNVLCFQLNVDLRVNTGFAFSRVVALIVLGCGMTSSGLLRHSYLLHCCWLSFVSCIDALWTLPCLRQVRDTLLGAFRKIAVRVDDMQLKLRVLFVCMFWNLDVISRRSPEVSNNHMYLLTSSLHPLLLCILLEHCRYSALFQSIYRGPLGQHLIEMAESHHLPILGRQYESGRC